MKNLMKQVTSSRDRSGTVWSPSVCLSRLAPLAQKNLWFCSEHVQMLQEDLLPSGQRGRNFEENRARSERAEGESERKKRSQPGSGWTDEEPLEN